MFLEVQVHFKWWCWRVRHIARSQCTARIDLHFTHGETGRRSESMCIPCDHKRLLIEHAHNPHISAIPCIQQQRTCRFKRILGTTNEVSWLSSRWKPSPISLMTPRRISCLRTVTVGRKSSRLKHPRDQMPLFPLLNHRSSQTTLHAQSLASTMQADTHVMYM